MSIVVQPLWCTFCGLEIRDGRGHNPAPIKSVGRCCFECNYRVVVIARLDALVALQKT
jgi:hypothetical protein